MNKQNLIDILLSCPVKRLAVCGMAKNTGKTVTLNYLVKSLSDRGKKIALTSIGRDGELWDILSFKAKPVIHVKPGMLVATARQTIERATAHLDIITNTSLETPLGTIVIARAGSEGRVELAGPSRLGQLQKILHLLEDEGIDLVLMDGALNRQSPAAPHISDAMILATGAVLADSIPQVAEITAARVEQLILPPAAADVASCLPAQGVAAVTGGHSCIAIAGAGYRRQKNLWHSLPPDTRWLLFSGALTDDLARNLLSLPVDEKITLVVKDATRVFLNYSLHRQLRHNGININVINPLNLLAVTVNPTAPEGENFPPEEFHRAIARALDPLPVFDLVQGYK